MDISLKTFLLTLSSCLLLFVSAQAAIITGRVIDAKGQPLSGVSVAMLHPQDSTLASFGITGKNGVYEINDAKTGSYLLQAALLGYFTDYLTISVNNGSNQMLNDITLQENLAARQMGEVIISGEKVPVRLRGDTVEYNAGSFKVKPNAPVEDLLRQLPGMQVDQAGNIKAMGKDVNKILVDGKEFFGNDPKVATKNLPADAISRVQTFGKKSDQTEFTGVDDGERSQTINLVLKDGKRNGYFGDVQAGGGTDGRYEGGAKLFKFRPKTQLAAIGQLNNINQAGFSFRDYLDFNGGIGSLLSSGGRFSLNADDDLPVDFGQPVTGDITSAVLGLNYSYEPRPKNRFNVSYMGNTSRKCLDNQTNTRNFLPDGSRYLTDSRDDAKSEQIAHRLSAKWSNDIDSSHQVTINAKAQLKNNQASEVSTLLSYSEAALRNRLDDHTSVTGHSLDMAGDAGFVKKMKGNWRLFQVAADAGYSTNINNSNWRNITRYYDAGTEIANNQYQDNNNAKLLSNLGLSLTRYLGNGLYLEPRIKGGYRRESLTRDQGLQYPDAEKIDSLSPHFFNHIYTGSAGLSLKKSTKKTQWNLGVSGQSLTMSPVTNGQRENARRYNYLLPSLFWRTDLAPQQTLSVQYNASVNTPATNQLLPVTYYSSALSGITGNLDLKPEYVHDFNVSFNHFDQFNMSSLFAFLSGTYTVNKVNGARTINADLSQHTLWVNTPYEGRIMMRGSYGRPVKKLGVDISANLNEMVSMAVSPVNNIDNKNTTWSHELSLNVNNRNNTVWNIRVGAALRISDSRYSLNKELNNTYYNYTGTGSISYQPNEHWFMQVSADVTHYTARSFDGPVTIPLLKAEISRYLLANQRATITLKAFDLLDQNKSIQRISQLNYLTEQRSNIIGRYFMLTFNYKLNKVGKGSGGAGDIEIRN